MLHPFQELTFAAERATMALENFRDAWRHRSVQGRRLGRRAHKAAVKAGLLLTRVTYNGQRQCYVGTPVRPYRKPLSRRALKRYLVHQSMATLHMLDDMAGVPRQP